jgi:anti-anti-sigma factor
VVDAGSGSAGRIRLRADGVVDLATAPILLSSLLTALETPEVALVELDLGGVSFLDARGVSAILRGAARARDIGCRLRLRNPQSYIRRVLEITGVTGACDVD